MSSLKTPFGDSAESAGLRRPRRSNVLSVLAALAFTPVTLGAAGLLGIPAAMAQSNLGTEAVAPLEPGEAVVTRFPHTIDGTDANGNPVKVIDTQGISVSIIDPRNPVEPPMGQHWIDKPQRMFVTADEVGQVFGVAIAQRPEVEAPTIFVASTAAYGLHMLDGDWMPGMWGLDGGPGTIYRLTPENGYKPEKFADVTLNGRENTGASLGNIAYDKVHDRVYVSDLETGMIHSLDAETGDDLGVFDHGNDGRAAFFDVETQQDQALVPVAFNPRTRAQISQCGTRFTSDPSCWNLADFRRRVWGLRVRTDDAGAVRLYYSVWGSDAFDNPDWANAGDDQRNSLWSVGFTKDGQFDTASVRREFFMPAFWPDKPRFGDKAANSNPVADISFPECSAQNVMLLAERGGMRNLGLTDLEPFARPSESRVLRYELGRDDVWLSVGRYDVGFLSRDIGDGSYLFAGASGGVDFGYMLDPNGLADMSRPSQSVWMTGDALCSPQGPCNDANRGANTDDSEVHGLQGSPADSFLPLEGGIQPVAARQSGLFRSYMIDTDITVDENGTPVDQELTRNDATKIGDVAVYQVCKAPEPIMIADPPEDWPVHTLKQSHNKWASNSHRVRASWHYREGSWHDSRRSWHWRDGSWHQRDKSWHRRAGSWHDRERSWHYKSRSFHSKRQTWADHDKRRSFHNKERSWSDVHSRGRSFHMRGGTWQAEDSPSHDRRKSHNKGQSYTITVEPSHSRRRSAADERPTHQRRQSQVDNPEEHIKGESQANRDTDKEKPRHVISRSRADDADGHLRRDSQAKQQSDKEKPRHVISRSRADNTDAHLRRDSQAKQQPDKEKPRHSISRSRADNADVHTKAKSRATQKEEQPQHSRRKSNASQNPDQPAHSRRSSQGNTDNKKSEDRHNRRESNRANQPQDDSATPQHRRRQSQMQAEQ